MALHAVHHVAILVSDYQASRHFYVDLLGFAVLRENFRPEKNDWKLDLALESWAPSPSGTVQRLLFGPARGGDQCGGCDQGNRQEQRHGGG